MKKGIEVSCEWDASGHEVTVVRQKRCKNAAGHAVDTAMNDDCGSRRTKWRI
jgi:hypothetical protein